MTPPDFITMAVNTCKKEKDFIRVWNSYGFLEGLEGDIRKNGFLEGLEGDIRKKVARSYYNMCCYLVDKKPNTVTALGFDMCVPLLPIIKRVVSRTEIELKNPKLFLEFCMDYVRDRVDHYEKVSKSCHVDMEAQLCCDIADYAVEIIKES